MGRRWLWLGLFLTAVLAGGCGTAAGNYFANRARDFGQIVRVEVNGGMGVGVVVEGGGLVHAGLGGGAKPFWAGVGWCYGEGHAFAFQPHAIGARGSQVAAPINPIPIGEPLWVGHLRQTKPHNSVHGCWWLLPGVFGESVVGGGAGVSRAMMWTDAALVHPTVINAPAGATTVDGVDIDVAALRAAHRWNHVHAFDVSVDVYAIFVHAAVGFSLGEFADFLLGWFGVDFAGDDLPFDPGGTPR